MKYRAHDCSNSSSEICRRGKFDYYSIRCNLIGCNVIQCHTNFPRPIIFLPTVAFTTCGGSYMNASGILTSPSYPNPYPRLADCIYLISQPNGTFVNISFISMDVNCQERYSTGPDYIEMSDGDSEDSPFMGRLCGDGSNVPSIMQTTQNHLMIR